MKKKFSHKFRKELKKQSRLAVAAAIGFLIAFSWRDTILAVTEKYVQVLTTMTGLLHVKLVSSLVVTIIGVLVILLTSRILE
jgi:hypothetical protein